MLSATLACTSKTQKKQGVSLFVIYKKRKEFVNKYKMIKHEKPISVSKHGEKPTWEWWERNRAAEHRPVLFSPLPCLLSDFEHHCLFSLFFWAFYYLIVIIISLFGPTIHSNWPDWSIMIIRYCHVAVRAFLLLL